MFQDEHPQPFGWLRHFTDALDWPVVVGISYLVGKYVSEIRRRVESNEAKLTLLTEKFMPTLIQALSEIHGSLLRKD